MGHDSNIVPFDKTFILTGYTVPCNGTVVAWELCYRTSNGLFTLYPGIWRMTGTSSNTDYELVQSNSVTYDAAIQTGGIDHNNPCQRVNLSPTDQFTAPARSVVGLYSNFQTQLLHTSTDSSLTTFQFSGNQSSVTMADNNDDVNYNIAIRVYLGKFM